MAGGRQQTLLAIALAGGGARAAYQVGLLRFLAKRFPNLHPPILTGVSAGAINAAYLAGHAEPFSQAVAKLEMLWRSIDTDAIFDTRMPRLISSFLRWSLRLATGGSRFVPSTRAIFDTSPLRALLERSIPNDAGRLVGIAENLQCGRLQAVGLTTTCYATGRSVTWVQSNAPRLWQRPQRLSLACELKVDHIMASSAVPLLFPAVKIGEAWHGDGGIRLTAPLSPPMYLGAERIIAVSTRYQRSVREAEDPVIGGYPPPAQVIGVLLNAIFLDMFDYDSLNMSRINQLIEGLPPERRGGMRRVEVLVLRPSEDLGRLAAKFEPKLPARLRFFTRGMGAQETRSADSLTMLMFEPNYLAHLIELGEADARARAAEIENFIGADQTAVSVEDGTGAFKDVHE